MYFKKLQTATSLEDIEATIAPQIRQDTSLTPATRAVLAGAVQTRVKALLGVKLPIALARRMVALEAIPPWAEEWVWLTQDEKFFNIRIGLYCTQQEFSRRYAKEMDAFKDTNPGRLRAAGYFFERWNRRCVSTAIYDLKEGLFFTRGGVEYVNLLRVGEPFDES